MIRILSWLRRARAADAADVDREIESHLEERIRQLVNGGMAPDEARRVAVERFGDLQATRRAMVASASRTARRRRWRDRMQSLGQDGRYALRQLRRAPGLSSVIVLTLGFGIGATSMMFGIVDRLLLRPPAHVREPERLGRLYLSHLDGENRAVDQDEVSYLRFTQLRDGARDVVDIAAVGSLHIVAGRGAESRRILAGFVSGNFWAILGVRPAFGRFFGTDAELAPDGANVAVLGHAYWANRLGADSAIVGREIDLGSRRFTVIGVAPPGFHGVQPARVDVWLPVTAVRARETNLPADWRTKNNLWWVALVARLYPEATPERAEAVLTATFARVGMGGIIDDATVRERARVDFGPLLEERGPRQVESTRIATWLAAIAGIVLLLACSNVANLLLARAVRRRREIAVRVALGVSRGRLLGQLFVEGLMLALAGAVVGLVIAIAGGRALAAFFLPNLAAAERLLDARVLAFAVLAAVAVGIVTSLAPALYAARQDVSSLIRSAARDGRNHGPSVRTLLVAGQCALSTTLLLGAGVFIRSLQEASATRLGFDARSIVAVRVERRDANALPGGLSAVYRDFADRLRSVPGVLRATTTVQIPFAMSGSTSLAVPGVDSAALKRMHPIRMNPVGIDYFETMGTRILRGRALDAGDGAGSARVLVVSDSMARALWPGADAIGKCVKVGGSAEPCSTVVGVAENTHQYEVRAEPAMEYWFPESQNQGGNGGASAVMVRVAGDPRAMIPTLRTMLQSAAPSTAYVSVYALGDVVDRVLQPWRTGAILLSAFGVLGLIIAGMGLYSALAYAVSQRTAELGLRMALGASPSALVARVVADGMRVTLAGIAVGLIVAWAAGRSINAVLFGVTTADAVVMPLSVVTLVVAALLASAIPARRASRVDPARTLRGD